MICVWTALFFLLPAFAIAQESGLLPAIHRASAEGDLDEVQRLGVEDSTLLELRASQYGFLPIHYAAAFGHADVVEWFLKQGSSPEARLFRGRCQDEATDRVVVDSPDPCADIVSGPLLLSDFRALPDVLSLIRHPSNPSDEQVCSYLDNYLTLTWFHSEKSGPYIRLPLGFPCLQAPSVIDLAAINGHTNVLDVIIRRFDTSGAGRLYDLADPVCQVTPLMYAAHHGRREVVRFLLERGADPNHCSPGNGPVGFAFPTPSTTPLELAVQEGDIQSIAMLLDAGADPSPYNQYDDGWGSYGESVSSRMPLLHMAIFHHSPERSIPIATALIEAGADPSAEDSEGRSAVVRAAGEEVAFLLDHGVDPHAVDSGGRTLLHYLALRGREGFARGIELLCAAGVDPNSIDSLGRTPLLILTHRGQHHNDAELAPAVTALLRYGADPRLSYEDGWTPLHSATFYNMLEVIKVLIGAGADVNATAEEGGTPLLQTGHHDTPDAALLLIEEGADIHVCDSDGATVLHEHVLQGHPDMVRFYLERGVDPWLTDSSGKTPLDVAYRTQRWNYEAKREEIVALLRAWMN